MSYWSGAYERQLYDIGAGHPAMREKSLLVIQLEQLVQRHFALLRNTGKCVTLPHGVRPDLCTIRKRCL